MPESKTVNVHVEEKGAGAESRDKRAAEQPDVRTLPAALEVRLNLANQDVSLTLEKNSNVDVRPPVFVARNGGLQRVDFPQAKADAGFYQDPDTGASFSVRLRHDGSGYLLSGTYFSEGVQYLLTPNFNSSETGSRTGDHDVMRMSSVLHLQNDFVDLLPGNYFFQRSYSSVGTDHTLELQVPEAIAFCAGVSGDLADVTKNRSRDYNDVTKDNVDIIAAYDFFGNRPSSGEMSDISGHPRRRRQVTPQGAFAVELLMVVDYDVRYAGINANFSIDVTFAGILVFDDPLDTYWSGGRLAVSSSRDLVEASDALEAFRGWALKLGASLPPSDHVMLFTGFNLTYGGSVSNAGLAYLGSACNTDYFFSIVEEYLDFRTVAVAAHELAHSLGARHDMDGNTCLTFDRYVMTSRFRFPTARTAQNPWKFSSCSVQYFSAFIDDLVRNDTNCLVTKDAVTTNMEIQPFFASLPGQVYPGDQFCQLSEGPDSYICRAQHTAGYDTTCYAGLQCYRPEFQDCDLKLPPDGLACGNKKWCENGTCVFSLLAPTAVDDLCPFGDDPVLLTAGSNCSERVNLSRGDCYDQSFHARCCQSCAAVRHHLPGCEFGDRSTTCDRLMCAAYDTTYMRHNCCDTCGEVLLTPTSSASNTYFTSDPPASTAGSPTTYSAPASRADITTIDSPPDSATGTLIAHSTPDSSTSIPIAHSSLDSTTDTPIANRQTDSITDTHPEVPTVSEQTDARVDLTSTQTAQIVRSSQETPRLPSDYSPSVDRILTPSPIPTDQPPVIHKAFSPPTIVTDLPPATPGSQSSPAATTTQTPDMKIKAQVPRESTDRPPAILKAFTHPPIFTVQPPVILGANTPPQIPTNQAPVIHKTFAPPPIFTDQPRVIHKTFSYLPILTYQTPVIQKVQPSPPPTARYPVNQRAGTRPPLSSDQTPVNQRATTPPVSTDRLPLTHGKSTSFLSSNRPPSVTDSSPSSTDISSQQTTSAIAFTSFRKAVTATDSEVFVDSSSSASSSSFAFTTNLDEGTSEKQKSPAMTPPTSLTDSVGLTSSPDRTARFDVTSLGGLTSLFDWTSIRELTSHRTDPPTPQRSTLVSSSTSGPSVGAAVGLTSPEPLRSAAESTLAPPVVNSVTAEQSEAGTSPTGSTSPAGAQTPLSLNPVSVVMSVPGVTSAPGLTSTQSVTSLLSLMPSSDVPHPLVTNIKQTTTYVTATTATNNNFARLITPTSSKDNFSFAKAGTVNPKVTSRGGKKTGGEEERENKTRDEGRKTAGRGAVPKPRVAPPLPSSPAPQRAEERPRGNASDRQRKYDEENEESVSKESEAEVETTDERGGERVGSSSRELGQQLQKVREALRNKVGSELTREQRLLLLVNLVTLLQQGLTPRDVQPAAPDITGPFGNDFGSSLTDPRTTRLTTGVKGSDPSLQSQGHGRDFEAVGLQQQGVSRGSAPSELPLPRSGPAASRQTHFSAERRLGYREPGGSSRRRRSPRSADTLTFERHRPLIQALWEELRRNSGRHRREGASSEIPVGDSNPADTVEQGFSARPLYLPQKHSLQPNLERHGSEPSEEVTEALYHYDDHVEEDEDEESEDLDDDIPEQDPFWRNDTVNFNDGFDGVAGGDEEHEQSVVTDEGSDAHDKGDVNSQALSDVIFGPMRYLTSLNSAEKTDTEITDKTHDVDEVGDHVGTDDSVAADDGAYESSDKNDDGGQDTNIAQLGDVEKESRETKEDSNDEHCENGSQSGVLEPGDKEGEFINDNSTSSSHDRNDRISENGSDFAERSARGERDEASTNSTSATSAHTASHSVTDQIHHTAPPGDQDSYLEDVESTQNWGGEEKKTQNSPIDDVDDTSSEVADNNLTQTPATDNSAVGGLQAALVAGDHDRTDHDASSSRRIGNRSSDLLVNGGNASRDRGSSDGAVDLGNDDDDEDSVRFVESGDDTNVEHNLSTGMNDITSRIDHVTTGVGDITTGIVVVMTDIDDAVSQPDRKTESGLPEKTPQVGAIALHSGSKLNESAEHFPDGDSHSAGQSRSMARSDKMAESGGAERLTSRDPDTDGTDKGDTGRRGTPEGGSVVSVTSEHVDTVLGRPRTSDRVVPREIPGVSQGRSAGHKRVNEDASSLARLRQHRATPPPRRLSGQPARVSKAAYSMPRGQLIPPEAMSGAWVTSGTSRKQSTSTTDANSSAIYLPTSTSSISPRIPRFTFDPGHTTVERKTSTNHRTSLSAGRRVGPKKSIRNR
ncbi:hypothetical protein C0Q70_07188 [Pomacea canaliculata]|uniref:Peptidase M12B domain-containing protein n=1 Tax=Pomacea canaliculata TaxID=400727 RepID=A0A2T7PEC2_POMCA|nr:hypothetical protein C0Q70_07188 [Pomacea canaliculata]